MEFTVFSTDSGPEIGTSERQANTIASCATWISSLCVRLVPMYGRILSPNFPAVFAAINSCAIAGQRIAVVSLRKKKKKRRRKKNAEKKKDKKKKKRRRGSKHSSLGSLCRGPEFFIQYSSLSEMIEDYYMQENVKKGLPEWLKLQRRVLTTNLIHN